MPIKGKCSFCGCRRSEKGGGLKQAKGTLSFQRSMGRWSTFSACLLTDGLVPEVHKTEVAGPRDVVTAWVGQTALSRLAGWAANVIPLPLVNWLATEVLKAAHVCADMATLLWSLMKCPEGHSNDTHYPGGLLIGTFQEAEQLCPISLIQKHRG